MHNASWHNTLMIRGSEEILNKTASHIPFCHAEACNIFISTSRLMATHLLCVHKE
jgi:hypothetical protein